MSALAMMQNGYLAATRSTGTPRDVEYQLFSRVTGKINMAIASGSFPDLAEALNDNVQLWQALALDVADADNALPASLRAQLFYLYEFTRAHTQKVLRQEADAQALADINAMIMGGLRASAPTEGTDQCPA